MTEPTAEENAPSNVESDEEEEEKLSLYEVLTLISKASRGYWAINLVNFGECAAYFGLLNLLVLYLQHDVGYSTNWAHSTVSFFSGFVTIGMFIGGGFISDWLGVRRTITLALVLILLGRLLMVLLPGVLWPVGAPLFSSLDSAGTAYGVGVFVSLVFVIGFGEAIIQPAVYAGVKEYSDKRTATMGYAIIYAAMNLGIVVESLVSPPIRNWTREIQGTVGNPAGGISGVYWFLIGVIAMVLVMHFFMFTKRVEQTQRIYRPEEVETKEKTSLLEKLRSIPILNARFLFFIFVLLPVRTLFAHQWLTIPDYIMRCFPAAVGERYEYISALNPLMIVVGVPLIAAWTRNVNIITMMIIGTSISAAATLLLVPEPNVGLLLTYIVVFSIGEAAWSSRFLEYVANLAPAGKVGAYMGIATIPWFLAKATTGLYSGRMLEIFVPTDGTQDTGALWLIYGCIALVSPIGLILARRWVESGVQKS